MSGETERDVSGWTLDTYAAHNEALRKAEDKFQLERDRRYAEVATEREKALKIKETADLAALGLAREIQTYKDEKANELREQINSERGLYATKNDLVAAMEKVDATIRPLIGTRREGVSTTMAVLVTAIVVVVSVAGFLLALYLASRGVPVTRTTS